MSAPLDPAIGIAIGVAILLSGAALIIAVAWARQAEGRLLALEALSQDRAERFRDTVQWFSDNWPRDAEWPSEVQRPAPKPPSGVQPPPAAPVSRPGASALTELRCALANFELVDETVMAGGHATKAHERVAHAFATWALAGAASRFAASYAADTEAEVQP